MSVELVRNETMIGPAMNTVNNSTNGSAKLQPTRA
jgi:hypothetical protein